MLDSPIFPLEVGLPDTQDELCHRHHAYLTTDRLSTQRGDSWKKQAVCGTLDQHEKMAKFVTFLRTFRFLYQSLELNCMRIPESDLIARAQQRDAGAFGSLYTLYLDEIYRYVYYRVSDHQEAEDLTEVVFLKAWQALPRFRSKGPGFRAWLYRIAHNAVIDRHRVSKTVVSLEQALDVQDTNHISPETAVEVEQETARLDAAISQLKPRLREVILNRFLNGLSHAETAHAMGLREGHVRVLQHRALKAIKDRLTEGLEQ